MLLITAFEPFDETGINSSQEALAAFMQRHGSPDSIATAILPVAYEADLTALLRVLEQVQPRAILHLGQTSRALVEVERIGINLKLLNYEEMRRGVPPQHAPILEGAPPAYFATIPVDEIVGVMQAAELPTASSAHAGAFLCNHILFRSLHYIATQELNIPAGFLHLPCLPEQAAKGKAGLATLPLETLVRSIGIAVDVINRQ